MNEACDTPAWPAPGSHSRRGPATCHRQVPGAMRDDRGMTRVLVLNGPNLGRLGTREPQTYGTTTHDELAAACRARGAELGLEVEVRQTDAEHEMLGWLHEAADASIPVVLNGGGCAHLRRAARACAGSAPAGRGAHLERARARGVPAPLLRLPVASGVIVGLGVDGYALALRWIAGRAQPSS